MLNTEVLSVADFNFFKELIFTLAGISIPASKLDLVQSRLNPRIKFHKLKDFSAYRKLLESLNAHDPEFQYFINLLTTNKTHFFREPQHFDFLQDMVVPELLMKSEAHIKLWSCACSSGEEPYSIALLLSSILPKTTDYEILATDIDTERISTAKNGVYPKQSLLEIPKEYQVNNLTEGINQADAWFKIKKPILEKINFKTYNLNEENSPSEKSMDKTFDIIFCRNVLMYFNKDTIRTLMLKLHRSLKDDGYLFIGHSENLQGCSDLWTYVRPAVYRKK